MDISIATNTGWVFNTRFYVSHTPLLVSNIANPLNNDTSRQSRDISFLHQSHFFLTHTTIISRSLFYACIFSHCISLDSWRLTLNPPASNYNLIELPTNVMSMTISPRTVYFRTTPNGHLPLSIVHQSKSNNNSLTPQAIADNHVSRILFIITPNN